MRAAVLTEINTPLQILDLDQEPPKGGEVRVRVKAAGVCMSDWHIMNGDWPLPLPMVLGHEAAGIVIEYGPGVDHVETGDHVIFSFRPHCGRCRYCCSGQTVLSSGTTIRRAGGCTTGPPGSSSMATRSTRWHASGPFLMKSSAPPSRSSKSATTCPLPMLRSSGAASLPGSARSFASSRPRRL
jgi:Zn-dependent alcohol dehydrogenase